MKPFLKNYRFFLIALFLAAVLLCEVFLGSIFVQRYYSGKNIQLIFFQITRGDSIYIKTPHGKEILIDSGQDLSILSALEKYRPFYDRHIDLLIVTHPDSDHYYGFLEVLRRFSVDNILMTGVKKDDPKYHELFSLAKDRHVNILYADYSTDFFVDDVFFDILSPLESLLGTEKNGNNGSLVIKVYYKNKSVLLTGDIEKKAEIDLLHAGVDLNANILKIPHHGSKSSSSSSFIRAVSPDSIVYSVGTKNSFGHPHQEVINRYDAFGAKSFHTNEGDVIFEW